MADTYAIVALRRKRARLAGEVEAAQRALAKQRNALATLDAVIHMFEPASNPDLIPAIRPASARNLYFRRGEQQRLCVAALRSAGKPTTTRQIADYALAAKGIALEGGPLAKATEHVRGALMRLSEKGVARKIMNWPDVWWELAVD